MHSKTQTTQCTAHNLLRSRYVPFPLSFRFHSKFLFEYGAKAMFIYNESHDMKHLYKNSSNVDLHAVVCYLNVYFACFFIAFALVH